MSHHEPVAIATKNAPGAIGPYSQAVRIGHFLFLAGQIPLDPESMQIAGTSVEEQTERVMKNIVGVLESEGLSLRNLVKTTVFLKNMGDFAKFNPIYERYLKAPFPARSTIEVARLPKDALIEIEGVAYYPEK